MRWLLLGMAAAAAANSTTSVTVRWVGDTPASIPGTTFGVPWPQGQHHFNSTAFSLSGSGQSEVPLQSWVTGYWRDGSIKWTGHALPALAAVDSEYRVTAAPSLHRRGRRQTAGVTVTDTADEVAVDTGNITVTFPKSGSSVVGSIRTASGRVVGQDGRLVLHTQSGVAEDVAARANASIQYFNFASRVDNVTVSDQTPTRALVTVRGTHEATSSGASHAPWLAFVLRFYLYAGADSLRIVHSLVFDQAADKDFVSGVGLAIQVPLGGEALYNRHVRLPGEGGGHLSEAVQGLTGLRRDPGAAVRAAQTAGQATPNVSTWDTRVSTRLGYIPAWNDYKLSQLSPDGFTLKKRTQTGQGWVAIPGARRASGLAYLGGATVGGLAVGLRDFWKRFPTGIDIAGAAGEDTGRLTVWLYSPEAAPLDLRPYHDGLGQDTYAKQLEGLQITYEDYEPGFNTPYGIARTSELFLHAFAQTPTADELAIRGAQADEPAVLVPTAEHILETKALGTYWSLPNTASGSSKAATLETHLDFLADFYSGQIEQRRWYGFLDYGDVMHTYDSDRHQWRYDVGGYAWDNSELSPDLFLWQQFLRTGRASVFRLAEALTRHTGEVDVYHAGDWKAIGTRHGVQHFADSAKQARIAQPQYRKPFYYLTGGDERVGELLDEALEADQTYGRLDPQRKVRTDGWTPQPGEPVAFSLGTDWAALAAGWLLAWERRSVGWQTARAKLTGTASGIAGLANGFVTGSGLYYIANGTLGPPPADPGNAGVVSLSHLNAVFGLPEVVSDLLVYWEATEDDGEAPAGFRQAWLDYCFYYGATAAQQTARYGKSFGRLALAQGHSRLTAYFSAHSSNATLAAEAAARVWSEFYNVPDADGFAADDPWTTEHVNGSAVLVPVDEATWVSTNAAAQYGLAAIQDLALAGGSLEASAYP